MKINGKLVKLEQLERLRSEVPPPPHDYPYSTSDSHQIPSQNKTSQNYKF